ncbi:MAG: zinc-ribbon domain-containing protein [Clostridiales bacterium]|nr:zinc-ribbon domain-containing protein [Clostridiales bacterium]
MNYCVKCGKPMEERDAYCSNCGAPASGGFRPIYRPVTPNVVEPDLLSPSPACQLAAGITGIVYGLALLGGGVYCILALTQYTEWAVADGVGSILAGVLCCIHSIGLLRRYSARKSAV